MGNSVVRYALFVSFMMLGGHFLFQHLPQNFRVDPKQVAAALTSPRPVTQAHVASLDEIVVPMKWEGVWVADVEFNDLYEVKMIVDTGASGISLSSQAAFDIGLAPDSRQGKVMMSTANGQSEAWVGQVRSIRLGEAERNNVRVIVMENFGSDELGGLLGLEFLNGFYWHIDQEAGNLILRPKS